MLEIKELTKSFGSFKALDGLNMTVPQGAVYGLVGPNGAGKSTAIRHVTGVYPPESGSVTLGGSPIFENAAVKSRIASVTDDLFFFSGATVEDMRKFYSGIYPAFDDALFRSIFENAAVKSRIASVTDDLFFFSGATVEDMRKFYSGIYPAFDDALFRRMGQAFDLPAKTPVRRFSKGMQKQAAFWLTIACRPELMVLDEPVDGLDPVMRRQVWSLILSDVAQQGTTILVSSHNLRELEDICDHVGIMDHGKMLLQRSLADMQGSTVKIQVVGDIPDELPILHRTDSGRMSTLIVRATIERAQAAVERLNPTYYDILPLSLEEIFIYELGGADHAIQDIIL